MSQLVDSLSKFWNRIQGTLFPFLEEELELLTEKQKQLVSILELIRKVKVRGHAKVFSHLMF